jgi:hypothetical protein
MMSGGGPGSVTGNEKIEDWPATAIIGAFPVMGID